MKHVLGFVLLFSYLLMLICLLALAGTVVYRQNAIVDSYHRSYHDEEPSAEKQVELQKTEEEAPARY